MDQKPTYEELERRLKDSRNRQDSLKETNFIFNHCENMCRLVLENISDTIVIADDRGNLVNVLPSTGDVFGFSHDEVCGFKTIQKLMGGTICEICDLEKAGRIQNVEWNVIDKHGNSRFLLINIVRVSIDSGTVLYAIRDVTEKKHADERLRKSEARYKALIDNMHSGVAIYEVKDNDVVLCFNSQVL